MRYSYKTIIGYITLEETMGDITRISFGKEENLSFDNDILKKAYTEINEYLMGKRKNFTFPYKMMGTEFEQKVYRELLKIPYGETRSYKEIAVLVGNPKAFRAIGSANHKNKLPLVIPCHRVIGKDGSLIGYAGGTDIKRFLLNLEKK